MSQPHEHQQQQPRHEQQPEQTSADFSFQEAAKLLLGSEHLDYSPASLLLDESFASFAQTTSSKKHIPSPVASAYNCGRAALEEDILEALIEGGSAVNGSLVAISGAPAPDGDSSLDRSASRDAKHSEFYHRASMVPGDLDRDEIRHLTAASGAAPRGGGREGCDFVNDRAAAAPAAFAAPQDARREQTQHDGAGLASRVATETASAADVEQWLRALEEVSGAADGDIAGAALAPGLQIPFDLLQQSADAALFAQLQMLSSQPFDAAPALDLRDTVVTRPVTGGGSSLAHPARNHSFAQNVPIATSGPIARPFSAMSGAESPRLSPTGSVSGHNQRRFATRGRDGDASRNYQASTLTRPGDFAVTSASQAESREAFPGGDCLLSGSGSTFPPISPTGGISPRHPPTHSHGASTGAAAASQKGSLLAAPSAAGSGAPPPSKCASSKLALEMLHKMRQGGLVLPGVSVPGQPLLSAADAAMLANDGAFVGFDGLEDVNTDMTASRAAPASASAPAPAPARVSTASAAAAPAAVSASLSRVPQALIGIRGPDASGALLIGSRPSQPAMRSPRTSPLSQPGGRSPRTGAGEAGTPGDARGTGDGSTQALDSPRMGASGAGGAVAAAGGGGGGGSVRAAGVKAQVMSEGRGGAGPATSAPLSGGGAGLSGGLSAEDDWRPRSRTRFDAEAMRKGEIKPRSMKERRRRDKISEGLRQLRQAIPESLLGAQQDMGAMIEAAVLHISNLQARVSKLERGAAIEEIVDRMQP